MTTQAADLQPQSFLYDERDGVATITFNRPERLNSLTFEVYRELTELFVALRSRDAVRVVVITVKRSSANCSSATWPGCWHSPA